jgi:hypothetical protein
MDLLRTSCRQGNRSIRRLHARRRPLVEGLEGRQLLSTFQVINLNDSGAGSLRQAILSSDATTGTTTNTIAFDIGKSGTQTITLLSALPQITHPVVIDGTTEPGYGTSPLVVLNGSKAATKTNLAPVGLELQADNSTIKGLVIDDFLGGGVKLDTASGTTIGADYGDTIANDYIGVTAAGNVSAPNGSFPVQLTDGAHNNSITYDVISGNSSGTAAAVHLNDDSYGNLVASNLIGTDSAGTKALGNNGSGVIIDGGSYGNTIGGTAVGAANLISGNEFDGVHIDGAGAGNLVVGNLIGTDITGTKALGNGDYGVQIQQSNSSTIGGTTTGAMNVISDSGEAGVEMDSGSAFNLVEGNHVGNVVYKGSSLLGNDEQGVLIQGGSDFNTIGGTTTAARNVISGNVGYGVEITGSSYNLLDEDYIGTDSTGSHALGNSTDGLLVANSSSYNVIATSVISGNGDEGLELDSGSDHNLIEGNFIGTDSTGEKPLGNYHSGIHTNESNDDTIGGTAGAATRNIISGNGTSGTGPVVGGDGINLIGSMGTLIEGNYIGLDAIGNSPLPNTIDGVGINGGSEFITVGGTTTMARNVISGNNDDGVDFQDSSEYNLAEGNYIGTNASGTKATASGLGSLGNMMSGVLYQTGASNDTTGGTAAGAANLIDNNSQNGVLLNSTGNGNLVEGDTIDDNGSGLSYNAGVQILDENGSTVARCTIENNGEYGILVDGSTSGYTLTSDTVLGNTVNNKY